MSIREESNANILPNLSIEEPALKHLLENQSRPDLV